METRGGIHWKKHRQLPGGTQHTDEDQGKTDTINTHKRVIGEVETHGGNSWDKLKVTRQSDAK